MMINWMYFPQNKKIEPHLLQIIEVFQEKQIEIDSDTHKGESNLESNATLSFVTDGLELLGYKVEKSKRTNDKIRVPVLFGQNGQVNLAFEVDAYSETTQTVIEVEGGRAVVNYQFLKDFYESCMMQGVKYFCVAVKNLYCPSKNIKSKDFEKVCSFFQALYVSNRMQIPLEGVLVIGY